MLDYISDAFAVLTKVFALYFALISLFALFKPRTSPQTMQRLRFAMLIPARNEESCIAGIVESLQCQNYPQELLDIYVVPNNCSDDTEGEALRAGAKIFNVSSLVRSKGAALREATAGLMEQDYDAFIVFDADNEASPNFVSAMNRTLCGGARVAKSRILSKNREQSWVCACYDIYFCVANMFMNRARASLGLSARLIGTGFAVKAEVLRELGGFQTETITEDAEFFATLSAAGEQIAFCEDAVTYDEEPLSFRTSLTQRRRWMSGIMQVAALKKGDLWRGLFCRESFKLSFDTLMQFVFAYVQAVMPFMLIVSFVAEPVGFLKSIPLSIAIAYLGAVANAVLALLFQKRLSVSMLSGILMYPVFLFSFIPLQTLSLFSRMTEWKEIKHTGVRRYASHSRAA